MSSEWMKVMLDEVARKKAAAEAAQVEQEMRRDERACDAPGAAAPDGGLPGAAVPGEGPGGAASPGTAASGEVGVRRAASG